MRILISNDDGYLSAGLTAMKKVLLSRGHEVYLCAPMRQKSASGHSITLFKRLEFQQLDEHSIALDGSPADTVKCACFGLFDHGIKFDLVISGINNGPNMGEDIFYSGTVAAAREGVINGIFAIACSSDTWEKQDEAYFEPRARVVADLIEVLSPEIFSEKALLNINFPDKLPFKGIRIARLGDRIYRDVLTFEEIESKNYVTLGGETPAYDPSPGSDLDLVNEGYIAVTPLAHKLYDPATLADEFIEKIKVIENLEISE